MENQSYGSEQESSTSQKKEINESIKEVNERPDILPIEKYKYKLSHGNSFRSLAGA